MQPNQGTPVDLEGFRGAMRDAGVEEVVDMTLGVYVEEGERLFQELSAAVGEGDLERVRATAHSLKSSSANIWAHEVSAMFGTMESAAQREDGETVENTFSQLAPEFERVMAYLSEAGAGG